MWHRLTLTAQDIAQGAEIEVLDLVHGGIQDNRKVFIEFMTALRARGYADAIPYEEIPVDIRSTPFSRDDTKTIYMNDTALEVYKQKGGPRQVEASVETLPDGARLILMAQTMFRPCSP